MGIVPKISHLIADSFNCEWFFDVGEHNAFLYKLRYGKRECYQICRNCGERCIDKRTLSALKIEADQINLKKGGNEAINESMSTLDAIEKFRREADELARRKNQQN